MLSSVPPERQNKTKQPFIASLCQGRRFLIRRLAVGGRSPLATAPLIKGRREEVKLNIIFTSIVNRAQRNGRGCSLPQFLRSKTSLHTVQLHLRYSATSFAAGNSSRQSAVSCQQSALSTPQSPLATAPRLWRQLPSSRGAEKRLN